MFLFFGCIFVHSEIRYINYIFLYVYFSNNIFRITLIISFITLCINEGWFLFYIHIYILYIILQCYIYKIFFICYVTIKISFSHYKNLNFFSKPRKNGAPGAKVHWLDDGIKEIKWKGVNVRKVYIWCVYKFLCF